MTIEEIICGIGGILIGALCGAWITYKFTISINKVENFRKAAAKLHSAFAPIVARYILEYYNFTDNNFGYNVQTILRDSLPAQAAAIEDFRPFIARNKKAAYQNTWDNYYLLNNGIRFRAPLKIHKNLKNG